MGNQLQHRLAALIVDVGALRKTPMLFKAAQAERCLVTAMALLGELVESVQRLEEAPLRSSQIEKLVKERQR